MEEDFAAAHDAGVDGVFTPGSRLDDCTNFAFQKVAEKKAAKMMEQMTTSAVTGTLKIN